LQDPETGNAIARIVDPAQQRQQILHVRGFQKLQAAVLHIWNVPSQQLQLEHIAVMRGAHEHSLIA
jgi:hypothetical protein